MQVTFTSDVSFSEVATWTQEPEDLERKGYLCAVYIAFVFLFVLSKKDSIHIFCVLAQALEVSVSA